MSLSVDRETPLHEDVAALLFESDALAAKLYPGEYRRPIVPETLTAPGIVFFVARVDGIVAGCCALFEGGDGVAELKRMIVGAKFRRRGVGMALLQAAEEVAPTLSIRSIRIEVGVRNVDGQALYRRAGYREWGPFEPYRLSPISLFFEKTLAG